MSGKAISTIAIELQALESETFEIVDYTDTAASLNGSTCSSTTSCCSTGPATK
jgi:hypothetical protein